MILCSVIGSLAAAQHDHDVIIQANDGFIGQHIGKLSICGGFWYHTFVLKIPSKLRFEDYAEVAVGDPILQTRFSPSAFFTNKQEVITMSIDLQCSANISSTAHTATITDCFSFLYRSCFQYLFRAKNLWCLDQLYNMIETLFRNPRPRYNAQVSQEKWLVSVLVLVKYRQSGRHWNSARKHPTATGCNSNRLRVVRIDCWQVP